MRKETRILVVSLLLSLALFAFDVFAVDKKISEQTALGQSLWDAADLFPIVDSGSSTSKKTTVNDFDDRYFNETSVLTAPHGGTGKSTYLTGDLIYAANSSTLSTLGIGTDGHALTMVSGLPSYSGLVSVAGGGTGLSTFTAGDLIYATNSSTFSAVAVGSEGQALKVNGGLPSYAGVVSVPSGGTGKSTFTTGDLLYASNSSTLSVLPVSSEGQALKVSGGLPSYSGVVSVPSGGTGKSTFTAGDIIYATNSSTLIALPVGSTGKVLTVTGGFPAWEVSTGGGVSTATLNDSFEVTNLVTNPSCKTDVSSITGSSIAAVRNSSTSALDGETDCTWDPTATSQTLTWAIDPLFPGLVGRNCEARIRYKGGASLVTANVQQNSVEVASDVTLTDTSSNGAVASINFPCGASTGVVNTVVLTTTGDASTAQYDVYAGGATNLTSAYDGTPTAWTPTGGWSANTTYTGFRQVTNRGTVVYDVFVSTSGAPTSANLSITLPASDVIDTARLLDTSNNYNVPGSVIVYDSGVGAYTHGAIRYTSTTSVTLMAETTSATYGTASTITQAVPITFGAGDTVNAHFELPIVGLAPQTAVRQDQTDFGWTSYSPTPSAGFGTTSNMAATYMRRGDSLFIKARFTVGTVAASVASVPLPTGLVIDSTKTPNNEHIAGYYANGNKASGKGQVLVDVTTSTTNLYFGPNEGSTSNLTANTGSNVSASTQGFNFFAGPIPIVGWSNSQAAPVLVGGVTTSDTGSIRTERAHFTNSGSCAISKQTGDWVASVSDPGVGRCGITFKTGAFASAPYCTCTAILSSTADTCFAFSAATTSGVTIYTRDNSGATGSNVDSDFYLDCTGPR